MRHALNNYFTAENTLGSSFGVLTLLSRWMSIGIILFSSEVLIQYGLLGVVGFIVITGLAFVAFGFVANTIKRNFKNKRSILDVIAVRTSGITNRIMMVFIFMLSIGMLLIQGFAVHLMLQVLFEIPLYISQFLFYLFCFIYAGLGGLKRILQLDPIVVFVLFSAVILIPVYFFIQEGIQVVYNGVWLYHPYLLYWKNYDSIYFVLTSFLLIFGFLMIDRVSWHRLFLIQLNKIRIAFSLTGVTLATVLLALVSMILISLSNKSYTNATTVLFDLITQLQTPALVWLFAAFCIVGAASTIGAEIHTLTTMLVRHVWSANQNKSKRNQVQMAYLLSGAITFILFLASFYAPASITNSIFFYGIVCVAMIPIMLLIIFGNMYILPAYMYGVICSILGGFFLMFTIDEFIAIWTSFIVSSFISIVVAAYQRFKKIDREHLS